jgi:SAM-dependent methyltransferase
MAAPSPRAVASVERIPAREGHLAEIEASFDRFAPDEARWRKRNRTYHRLIASLMRFSIPEGSSVLELGCGTGDLLAALEPSKGVGVDISRGMVETAAGRHPELEFVQAAAEEFLRAEEFDYVVLSDLVPYAYDVLAILGNAARMTHERSRIIVHSYSQLWRPAIRLAEMLRLKPRKPIRNWVAPNDVANLLDLAGFEVISVSRRILLPKKIFLLSAFLNGLVANIWPFQHLCVSYWVLARLRRSSSGCRSSQVPPSWSSSKADRPTGRPPRSSAKSNCTPNGGSLSSIRPARGRATPSGSDSSARRARFWSSSTGT